MPLTARSFVSQRLPGGYGGRVGPYVANTAQYGALRGPLRNSATFIRARFTVPRPHITAIVGTSPSGAPVGGSRTVLRSPPPFRAHLTMLGRIAYVRPNATAHAIQRRPPGFYTRATTLRFTGYSAAVKPVSRNLLQQVLLKPAPAHTLSNQDWVFQVPQPVVPPTQHTSTYILLGI